MRRLAVARPTATDALELLRSSRPLSVSQLVVTNTSASSATFSVYLVDEAEDETMGDATVLLCEEVVTVGTSYVLDVAWGLSNDRQYIGIQSHTASALTFSFFGA